MTAMELTAAIGLVSTLITTIAGAAWFVGAKLVQGLREFDALRRAVDANTAALSNGLRAEVRAQGEELRHLRSLLGGLPCLPHRGGPSA